MCSLQAEDDDGVEHETLELCYVIKSSGGPLYLSHMAQRSLDFLHRRYPRPMTAQQLSVNSMEANPNGDSVQGSGEQNTAGVPADGTNMSHTGGTHDVESYKKALRTTVICDGSIDLDGNRLCKCPERVKAPDPPKTDIPMTENNIPRLKQLILDHYGSSAFNQCENQLVSTMEDTPPMKIFIPADYKPYTAVNAAPVPLHAQGQVKAMITKQVKMGIIKPIGLNDPSFKGCSRMVIVRKANGEPRGTVDLKRFNSVVPRQSFPSDPPIHHSFKNSGEPMENCDGCFNGVP